MDRKSLLSLLIAGFLVNAAGAQPLETYSTQGQGYYYTTPSTLSHGVDSEPCPQHNRLVFGGSFYYLSPYFSENIASVTSTGLGTASPATSQQEFDWNFQPAWRIWAGFSGPAGFGFRAGYFQFDNSANQLDQSLSAADAATTRIDPSPLLPVLPGGFGLVAPGLLSSTAGAVGVDLLTFNSSLAVRNLDLEATYTWKRGRGTVLFAGGARYTRLDQGYSAFLNNPSTSFGGALASEQQSLDYNRQFEGWGLTAALEGILPIGRRLSLYGNARGSFLVGTTTTSLNYLQVITDPTGAAGGNQRNTASVNSTTHTTLPTLELELGAQYTRNLGSRANLFLRAGIVNQTYFGAGNASNPEGNLGLFGGQFSLGFGF